MTDRPRVLVELGVELDRVARQSLSTKSTATTRTLAHRRWWRWRAVRVPWLQTAAGVFAAAAIVGAVIAIAVTGLGPGAPAAFAGWTATPTKASPEQSPAAESRCQTKLAASNTGPFRSPTTGWQVALLDTRGPFNMMLLQSGDYDAACFTGPSFTSLVASGFTLDGGVPPGQVRIQSSGVQLLTPNGQPDTGDTPGGPSYGLIEGWTGASVTGVDLALADGAHVQATVANGWFAAWWPGTVDATSAEITTANGTTTQQLAVPPSAPATGAANGTGSTGVTDSTPPAGGADSTNSPTA